MDKVKLAKMVSRVTITIGTGKIIHDILQRNVEPERTTDKVAVKATSFVIGGMTAEALSAHVDRKIDELVAWWYKEEVPEPIVLIQN
jgi:hypothetical protein